MVVQNYLQIREEARVLPFSLAAVILEMLIIQKTDVKVTRERRLCSPANYLASSERPKGLYTSRERKDPKQRDQDQSTS